MVRAIMTRGPGRIEPRYELHQRLGKLGKSTAFQLRCGNHVNWHIGVKRIARARSGTNIGLDGCFDPHQFIERFLVIIVGPRQRLLLRQQSSANDQGGDRYGSRFHGASPRMTVASESSGAPILIFDLTAAPWLILMRVCCCRKSSWMMPPLSANPMDVLILKIEFCLA